MPQKTVNDFYRSIASGMIPVGSERLKRRFNGRDKICVNSYTES